ncbi:hypothetical protein J7E91_05115 [Streptomyces sp. ISL-99]|uniref:hypothetical protein n=1 Tax=Streptomyces sp. ISL-99 TaxID=2819193 RepID=UPI001BE8CB62|nr:hypothetical protein [Streptomyces sp. ISL-99]MBT2524830.1 hypothetical protein [Streptomyces sp. ISL-99]
MTLGDHGPYGSYPPPFPPPPPPPVRRTWLIAGGAVAALAVVSAVAVGAVLYVGKAGTADTPSASSSFSSSPSAAPVPSVSAVLPSDAPAALPSLLARPVVRPTQAFPEKTVRLADGAVYHRVDVGTTTECERGMSQELAAITAQGGGCLQLTSALFTDAERRSQVTVGVLSLKRAEDAASVFGMVSMDPVTYQVVSLDPPPEAGLPTVPPGSAGVFRRLMTVRSVVFSNAQWADGSETREAELTEQATELLTYVNGNITAHEQGKASTGSG